MTAAVAWVQAACVAYLLLACVVRLVLIARAAPALRRGRGSVREAALPPVHRAFELPVTILVVAHDAEADIVARVRPLLALDYPEFEVVVVNDGSEDATLRMLEEAFALEVFPEAHWRRLEARPVRAIHHSRTHARLRVVDKQPGGDADALNCGVNASRFPLVLVAEDGEWRTDALHRMAEPFVEHASTIATCSPGLDSPVGGRLREAYESLRALRELLIDVGRSSSGAAFVVPRGAVLLRKDVLVEARGFRDMSVPMGADLLARMQAAVLARGDAARVRFVVEPIYRRHPAERAALRRSRPAAARAIAAARRRYGARLARTSFAKVALVLASHGQLLEGAALAAMALLWAFGAIAFAAFAAYVAMALALRLLVSATALAVEAAFVEWSREPTRPLAASEAPG